MALPHSIEMGLHFFQWGLQDIADDNGRDPPKLSFTIRAHPNNNNHPVHETTPTTTPRHSATRPPDDGARGNRHIY